MPYLEKYNSDDVHARAIIAGLLAYLNQEVFILNTWNKEDKEQEIVEIPFYYSMTGDERYLQDFFAHTWNKCLQNKLEGNFDAIPRGVVKLDGINIETGSLTQRFIRGTFNRIINKSEDGIIKTENLESFNAQINSIPVSMDFSVELRTATITDAFKIQQTLIEVFYKSKTFYTTYKGMMVPCSVGFPEQIALEKTFEFSYPSEELITMTFNLAVSTFQPVADEPNLGSNNAIANVNGMNDWINAKPTNSYDTYTDDGIYARALLGNDNAYFVGESRRARVAARMGHNSYSDVQGNSLNNLDYTKDNRSYEMSSVRKNSNRIEKFIFGSFGDIEDTQRKITLTCESNDTQVHAGTDVELKWSMTGYVHKMDLYCYNKDENGNAINIEQIDKYIPASQKSYEWHMPNKYSKSGFTADIAINSSTGNGKDAKAYAVIDEGGMIVDVVIENEGKFYDDSVVFDVDMNCTDPAQLIPVVQNGKIVDCEIRNRGNYIITEEIESSVNDIYVIAVSSAGNVASNEIIMHVV